MKTILNNNDQRIKITDLQFDQLIEASRDINTFIIWSDGKFHTINLTQFKN